MCAFAFIQVFNVFYFICTDCYPHILHEALSTYAVIRKERTFSVDNPLLDNFKLV